MPFEKFDKRNSALGRKPNVTIQTRGIISINQSAYRRIGGPEYVDLLFDSSEGLIGIHGTSDIESGHKVRVSDQQGAPAVISGTAFTRYYDIDTTTSRRWEPRFDGQMLIIDLKEEGKPIGGGRRPKAGEDEDD